jgi:hypothetical protein
MSFVTFVFFGLLVLFVAFFALRAAKKRREALGALAGQLGLDFDPSTDPTFHSRYEHALFSRGHSRKAYNVLRGKYPIADHQFDVVMGDYRYTTGSGKNQTTHRRSIMLLTPTYSPVKSLLLRREWLGDKLLGALGFDDIDFESEEFSRKFLVKSDDKQFAYAVIDPRMIDFLLQTTPPHVELRDGVCLLYEGMSSRWSPDEFRKNLAWANEFFQLWPEQLLAELKLLARPGSIHQ